MVASTDSWKVEKMADSTVVPLVVLQAGMLVLVMVASTVAMMVE